MMIIPDQTINPHPAKSTCWNPTQVPRVNMGRHVFSRQKSFNSYTYVNPSALRPLSWQRSESVNEESRID
ncbi:hypothetical protein AAMO2058_000406100 [Amorphochlora amoebiformis]